MYCSFGHADMIYSIFLSHFLYNLNLLSISVCNIVIAWYLFWNPDIVLLIILLPVCTSRYCLITIRTYFLSNKPHISVYNTWTRGFYALIFLRTLLILLSMLQALLFVSLLSFVGDSSSEIFVATLIDEFVFVWFLSWLLNVRYTPLDVIVLCATPHYTSMFCALHLLRRYHSAHYTSLDVIILCAAPH